MLHVMEGHRPVCTETQVVDVQPKLGFDDEAGKGDHASEQKAQVFEVHQKDRVLMMMEQEELQKERSRSHQSSRTSRRLRRQ